MSNITALLNALHRPRCSRYHSNREYDCTCPVRDLRAAVERLEADVEALERERATVQPILAQARQERDTAKDEAARLREAVQWALGEVGEFPPRKPGQGAYWWRTELRERAAIEGCMP